MLHRVSKKNDVNKDKWIGVGGKFEPGEAPVVNSRYSVVLATAKRARQMALLPYVSN